MEYNTTVFLRILRIFSEHLPTTPSADIAHTSKESSEPQS